MPIADFSSHCYSSQLQSIKGLAWCLAFYSEQNVSSSLTIDVQHMA